MQKIIISQYFAAPRSHIFQELADHVRFGEIVGANISRIQEGQDGYPNGVGSVRRIAMPLGMSFQETIVEYDHDSKIVYSVSQGSPIKSHRGVLVFSDVDGGTLLDYSIEFEPRWPVPGLGSVLHQVIKGPIDKGLKQFAQSFTS